MLKISAIICTHNRMDLLPKAIQSLLDQDMDKHCYEIIVVDNASTDKTKEVCNRFISVANLRYVYENTPGLSVSRNRGVKEAKGKYVAFMDDDAIASAEWLKNLLNAFENTRPVPASVGGKIEPIWEVPKPDWFPDYKKPYITILDYGNEPVFLTYPKILYGTNMAFTKEALDKVNGFRTDVGRNKQCLLSGEEVEVYRQFAEKGLPIYYFPHASVRHFVPKNRLTKKWLYSRHYWQGRSEVLVFPDYLSQYALTQELCASITRVKEHVQALWRCLFKRVDPTFRFSHIASINQHLGRNKQLIITLREPVRRTENKIRMLVISRSLPRYDRGSGHLRLFHILEILASQYEITYFTENYSNNEECNDETYNSALSSLGIKTFRDKNDIESLLKKDFQIVFFEFYDAAIRHLKKIKEVLPLAATVIDTVDVHFARELQMADVHQDSKMKETALETKKKELDIYQQADLIWTVTNEDRNVLLKEVPGMKIDVVPNIHKFKKINRDNIERNSLLFIGNFWHQPNEDAVIYFCKEILPLIKKEVPDIVFHIVGNAPTQRVKELEDNAVKVIGWVPDTTPYLERCHISIVPLRYGAGLKGKVGEAMSSGIPVVSTPVGVQGMDISNGDDILVSDTPEGFASNVIRLLRDDKLYSHISFKSIKYIKDRYDFNIVTSSVLDSIKNIVKPDARKHFGWIDLIMLTKKTLFSSKTATSSNLASEKPKTYEDMSALNSFSGIGNVQIIKMAEVYQGQKAFVKISGSSPPGVWSFARTKRFELPPDSRYEFKGWMLIKSTTGSGSSFKYELYDGTKWLQNFESTRYNMSQKGTWQQLHMNITIPSNITPIIRLAVEKRPNNEEISTEILIGDIRLLRS